MNIFLLVLIHNNNNDVQHLQMEKEWNRFLIQNQKEGNRLMTKPINLCYFVLIYMMIFHQNDGDEWHYR